MLGGFNEQIGEAVSRTEMEDGPPKQTRRKSRVLATQSVVALLLTKTAYTNFLTWHRVDLSYGSLWFNRTNPITGATVLSRIVGGKLGQATPSNPDLEHWSVPMQIEYWDS